MNGVRAAPPLAFTTSPHLPPHPPHPSRPPRAAACAAAAASDPLRRSTRTALRTRAPARHGQPPVNAERASRAQVPVRLDSPRETPSLPCAAGRFVLIGREGYGRYGDCADRVARPLPCATLQGLCSLRPTPDGRAHCRQWLLLGQCCHSTVR